MHRILAVTLALSIALATAPSVNSAEGEQDPELWTLVVTPDGHEFVPGPFPRGQEECGASAPEETYCTTELHVSTEVWSVALGASFEYEGTLELRLFHATSVLVMQVHVVGGWPVGFNLYGEFPITPAIFWHECFSYELGAAGNEPMPLPYEENGTPGGSGVWDCFVLYPIP